MIKNHIGFGMLLCVVCLAAFGLILWGSMASQKVKDTNTTTQTSQTSREVALACTTDMATQFHIHPELTIIINGVEQTIPANIGITPTCMTSIHTHDATGTIHVEAPVERDFKLADFFAVWGKPFNKGQILDSVVDSGSSLTVTVNGTAVDMYENTVLHDKDQIVISYVRR